MEVAVLNVIQKDLLYAIFKLRKTAIKLSNNSDLRINEVMALIMIDSQCSECDRSPLASEVGEMLSISHSAVSQIITSLEKKGYVCRNISENDKRQYRFTLTETGRHVANEMKLKIDERIGAIVARIGEAKIIALSQTLNEIADYWAQMQNDINDITEAKLDEGF